MVFIRRDTLLRLYCFLQASENFSEAIQARLKILDNIFGQIVRLWQVIEVGEALVLQPEHVRAGFVARDQLFVRVASPATLGIFCGSRRVL
jgi:hypothetical protein